MRPTLFSEAGFSISWVSDSAELPVQTVGVVHAHEAQEGDVPHGVPLPEVGMEAAFGHRVL